MNKINIDLGNCVKVSSKNSSCTNCKDVCQDDAISFLENIPQISSKCTNCCLCLGVCPTEAISLYNTNTLDVIFENLEKSSESISCDSSIPHVGAFHVEHIISYTIINNKDSLTIQSCKKCYDQSLHKSNEANYLLKNLGIEKEIKVVLLEDDLQSDTKTPNRRDFLKRVSLKGAIKTKLEFDHELEKDQIQTISIEDTLKIRNKDLPNKRKLFYLALKRLENNSNFATIPEDKLTFISQKHIDTSCDNCSICYRVCPTEALQSDKKGTKILFDTLSCVKCRLCHDVCEKQSITLKDFNTKSIFEPSIHDLIKFNLSRCEECGVIFVFNNKDKLCQRCKIEEEEAKSLWGIQ